MRGRTWPYSASRVPAPPRPIAPPATRYAINDGVSLAYQVLGSGDIEPSGSELRFERCGRPAGGLDLLAVA